MSHWKLTYDKYVPSEEKLRETLCALGNGYFVTRGAMEGSSAGKNHYPGTYLAGGYNRLKTEISGRVIENEDLVNWPDWLVLRLRVENDDWFDLDATKILDYKQELDLESGILERSIHFKDSENRETLLVTRRLVMMDERHIGAIQWKIKPINWSGTVTVHSALDGSVINAGVERYRELNGKHLEVLDKGITEEEGIFLKVKTVQSEVMMGQAARTRLYPMEVDQEVIRKNIIQDEYIAQELQFRVSEMQECCLEKTVAIYTSRDKAISNPVLEARKHVFRVEPFEALAKMQQQAWQEIWDRTDTLLEVGEERNDQLLLRLHIFHLFQTSSYNITSMDAGVPPRGWHGEAYRGHILWDEIFIFPFLNLTTPEITRSLLKYRFNRLPEAREAAQEMGYGGAMYPWQSGSNGREESQIIHLNPQSGNWIPDNSRFQRHVNAAIAYNTWQYYEITCDREFLTFYGAEMMLDIACFWASKVTYNEEKDKYEILKVVGPDEYHTRYPGSTEPGLRNNAYTNVMAAWTLIHAKKALAALDERRRKELMLRLKISAEDLQRWDRIVSKMFIPFITRNKIIAQFEGFEKLKDLDWEKYHKKYGEILRLDRILESEGDSVNNYKAVKQADVLMLFYLFSAEELGWLFEKMGYSFDAKQIPANINYYEKITAHGSTLSKLVHSWVLARSNRTKSWHNFKKALISDFEDIQGGTTHEGIHLGAMAGTVDLVHRCYTGMVFREGKLELNPQLPKEIERIKFKIRYRGHWIILDLTHNQLKITSAGGWKDHIKISIRGVETAFDLGDQRTFSYSKNKVEVIT